MPEQRQDACRQERYSQQRDELLKAILKTKDITFCEYLVKENRLLIYDDTLTVKRQIPNYLAYLEAESLVHPEDRQKARAFCQGRTRGDLEVRAVLDGKVTKLSVQVLHLVDLDFSSRLPLLIQDVTQEKHQQALLEERATKDSLTRLYNPVFGRELINEYLKSKDPYATCGLMVLDLDYFKYANDTYGHLFGDQVLIQVANLLRAMFDPKDVIMRVGGDEFVVFLKDIAHSVLLNKAMNLIRSVRELNFEGKDIVITCSVGVCFLSENDSGYTYDQIFENADWALYRAKENGRNCYVFCDSLQRFELAERDRPGKQNIDSRYLHNDIISTAFEIFEKMSSFTVAIELLMDVIGYRFQLDRITVIRTDIKEKNTGRQYQWLSDYAPPVLEEPGSFTKEDFITLFQSYDEHQTTVLQQDNLGMYSPEGAALLMQGGAKTVLYAAMYCEGKYTGAISYVVCREKRYWSKQSRKELGEVTKIISAHLARSQATGRNEPDRSLWTEYDSLTGLISFSRFRTDAEYLIVGNYADSHLMAYSDFAGFKYFNKKYGYAAGDRLLEEYGSFMTEKLGSGKDILLTRVISDQFLMLIPYDKERGIEDWLGGLNEEFERTQSRKFKGARIRVRTGVYIIEPGCVSSSAAMDAANYARRQITGNFSASVRVYDGALRKKQRLENEIANGLEEAVEEQRFKVYLQPRVSLESGEIVGAEALVRWQTEDGALLNPAAFIPLCEASGRIEEMDFYVFEEVVKFIAANRALGRRQIPISVNASVLHASDPGAVEKYQRILKRYGLEPSMVEIELTETATVKEYESARRWFRKLRDVGICTVLDDFGAGYSLLNSALDIPVDTVKLDRALIANCTRGERGIVFLTHLVGMIKGLGYHVVCEGVETRKQAEVLLEIGCQEAQGFLFYRPMPMEEYEKLVYGEAAVWGRGSD